MTLLDVLAIHFAIFVSRVTILSFVTLPGTITMQRHYFRSMISLCSLNLMGLSLVSLLSSCSQVKPLKPELTIQVQPSGTDSYTVSGTTNLPPDKIHKTSPRVLVQAIRKLVPIAASTVKRSPNYVIVAQQWVSTQDGNWQATLKLRQPSANGGSLESWQQSQSEALTGVAAEQQVTFVASTTPIDRNLRLEGDAEIGTNANLSSEVLQVSTDGSRYLKAKQTLMLALPQVANQAPLKLTQPVTLVKANPIRETGDMKKQEKTDAPLGENAYVR